MQHTNTFSPGVYWFFCKLLMDLHFLHSRSGCYLLHPESSPAESRVQGARALPPLSHWHHGCLYLLCIFFLCFAANGWSRRSCWVHTDFLFSSRLLLQGILGLWNKHWTLKIAFCQSQAYRKCSWEECGFFPTRQVKQVWFSDVAHSLSGEKRV